MGHKISANANAAGAASISKLNKLRRPELVSSSDTSQGLNVSFGGNDADDEEDEDDSVFAHVFIGTGVAISGNQRPRSDGGGRGHPRQSNSFELATSPVQRQRHLRFLRTVHSVQARLSEETSQVKANIQASYPKSQFLSVDVHVSDPSGEPVDEDDDEGDEVSVQGLGKRIRKLSSRTIEFCDSIDELQVKSLTATADTMGNEMQKGPSPSITIDTGSITESPKVTTSQVHRGRVLERGNSDNPVSCKNNDMAIPQFSLSVESDCSHRSHDSASTVITNTTLTTQSPKGSSGQKNVPSEPRQIPSKPTNSTTNKEASSSSSFTGTLTSWASSLMSMRHRSSSSDARQKRDQSKGGRSTSNERPLTLKDPQVKSAVSSSHLQSRNPQQQQARPVYVKRQNKKTFKRQDTPRNADLDSPQSAPSQSSMYYQRRGALQSRLTNRLIGMSDGSSSSQSFGSLDHMTPPSIVCTEHEEDSSRNTSNSSNATPIGAGSSLDDALEPDCDTPIMDEFAQFLNASIHPPNELSVPRCYPDPCPTSPTLLHPMSMPGSRRSSATRGAALVSANYRNARSLSLGYQQQQQSFSQRSSQSPSPLRGVMSASRGSYGSGRGSGNLSTSPTPSSNMASPGGSRPVLRRESAQDFGDDVEVENPRMKLNLPSQPQPPDLKIELLSETSSNTSPSSNSPFLPVSSLSPYSPGDHGPNEPFPSPNRRPSHCGRTPPIARNKSAPATPLSRSITNMNAQHRMARSPSKDGYLMVPERLRGSSLPEGREQKQESDLYRLRQFTVSNKRIVQRSDSLQPRRSVSSIHSSASR